MGDVDSSGNPTILNLTPQLLPILDKVLSPPEDQVKDSTRAQLVQMVKFIASKHPREISGFERLREVASS